MTTLTNVNQKNAVTVCDVLKPSTPSPEFLYEKGVSLEYAHNVNEQWFVLRVSYGKELIAYKYLKSEGFTVFLPFVERVKIDKEGKKHRYKKSLLPNLLFVQSSYEKITALLKHTVSLSFLHFYYDRTRKNEQGKNPPLIIANDKMENFISIISVQNEHVKVSKLELCHFKSNDKVRVVHGSFSGVEGRVSRLSGQQRVVVEVEGLCAIATAYIPTAFLKKINK